MLRGQVYFHNHVRKARFCNLEAFNGLLNVWAMSLWADVAFYYRKETKFFATLGLGVKLQIWLGLHKFWTIWSFVIDV